MFAPVITGHDRDAGFFHEGLGLCFVPHGADGRRRRSDENDARGGARFRELRVLGQEPVAWVNCLRAGFLRSVNDFGAVEIARVGRRRTYPKSLVGKRDMHRRAIGVRIDGGARNAKPPGCPDDPAGDLAAIGDQDFRKHRVSYHTLTPRRAP